MPQGLPAAHETTHVDVRQQRGQGRPLRAAPALVLVARRPVVTPPRVDLLDRRLQPHLDQPQEVPVADAPGQRSDQLGMRDTVKVA
jgi:hypothetical protein